MKTTGKIITVVSAQFEHVETGIYRNVTTGTNFERPKVRGKRTWRSLETKILKHAREELHRSRSGLNEAVVERAKSQMTIGEIARRYQKDGYHDSYRQPRHGKTMESESRMGLFQMILCHGSEAQIFPSTHLDICI